MKIKKLLSTVALTAATVSIIATSAFAAGSHNIRWGYSGHEGPENWGTLSPDYHACKTGLMQSPIDLSGGNMWDTVSVKTDYKPAELEILHNGHTVQFNVGNGSTMTSHAKTYDLVQIHFHTPSEHVSNGKPYPMEAHFVHQASDGTLGVIGVFYQQGEANSALQAVFDNIPTHPAEAKKIGVQIDPADILPARSGFYRYMGSLTTPPCSEGVNWFVLKKPATASKAQLDAMHAAIGDNARPAQMSNNRLILEPSK